MKIFLSFVFMFLSFCVYAQDYYLTKNKNQVPLAVNSAEGITKALKAKGLGNKYQAVVLSKTDDSAFFTLLPASLKVRKEEEGLFAGNFDIDGEDFGADGTFVISMEVKDAKEDIIAKINEGMDEKLDVSVSKKTYGRITYEVYSFSDDGGRMIILAAPFYGKFVEFIYNENGSKKEAAQQSSAKKNKNEGLAALGLAASALNKAVFKNSVKAISQVVGRDDDVPEEDLTPTINNWAEKKINAASKQYSFALHDNGNIYSYTMTLPVSLAPKIEEKGSPRIVFMQDGDSFMWLEPIFKGSKAYNEEVLNKYASGKKFTALPVRKIKVGGKIVSFSKKTALNLAADSFFFKEGERKFVLSFVAPSSKAKRYEAAANKVLNAFTSLD